MCSSSGPMTRMIWSGFRLRAVVMTCSISGLPAMQCMTLGVEDFMRVPCPAARMMMLGMV